MKTSLTHLLVVAALVAAPLSLSAQRGGGRGNGSNAGGRKSSTYVPDMPASSDIDRLDPIALLITNQKDLELTNEVVGQLTNIDASLIHATKPSFALVDSLRATIKAASESADGPGAVRESVRAYNQAVQAVRLSNDEASKQALELLAGDPRKKAEKLLQDRRDQFDRVTQTKRPDA